MYFAKTRVLLAGLTLAFLPACATGTDPVADTSANEQAIQSTFQQDRASILALAGDFKVSFDFTETVALAEGYELKEPKLSGGHEVVRVIEDHGDFISLQHILVVGGDDKFPVKHWRQDWQYEPKRILTFIGGNAWEWRDVPEDERRGAWSQTVYQVDDAPRYSATARWTYEDGLVEWTPQTEWRPLPRRDMTTRDDYHAMDAINRHVLTPAGWVHEQDNSKLVLRGEPHVLAREIGVNTYKRDSEFDVSVATDYWSETEAFWAGVRAEWAKIEAEHEMFAITIKGETEDLYMPLLILADDYANGDIALEPALTEARSVINSFITDDVGQLASRLRPATKLASAQE